MSNPYGPSVLPQPNLSFADFLSGMTRGVQAGADISELRRKRREEEEDRNLYLRQLTAQEAAQPGAQTETSFLAGGGAEALTPSSRMVVEKSKTPYTGRLEFRPQPVAVSQGPAIHLPASAKLGIHPIDIEGPVETAPGSRYFQTATGAVVDRQAANAQLRADALARHIAPWDVPGYEEHDPEYQRLQLERTQLTEQERQKDADAAYFVQQYPQLRGMGRDEIIIQGRQLQTNDVLLGRAEALRRFDINNPLPTGTERTPPFERVAAVARQLMNHPRTVTHLGRKMTVAMTWSDAVAQAEQETGVQLSAADRARLLRTPGGGAKDPQAILDQVTAEHPEWTDAQIRAEARRRSQAGTP